MESETKEENNELLFLLCSGYRSQGGFEEEDPDLGDPRHRIPAGNGSNRRLEGRENFRDRNL